MLEAERQFRKVIGYRDLAKLAVAIEHDLDRHRQPDAAHTLTEEAAIVATVRHTHASRVVRSSRVAPRNS